MAGSTIFIGEFAEGNGLRNAIPAATLADETEIVEALIQEARLPRRARAPADILDGAAGALETEMPALMAMGVRQAGKTVVDAVAEVREAVERTRGTNTTATGCYASLLSLGDKK